MAGNVEVVGWLLQRGVDPNLLREHDRFSLLMVAVNVGEQMILEMLLNAGADPSIADSRNLTPLHSAAADNNLDAIKALVNAGAPIEPEGDDFPPLNIAVRDDRLDAVKLLIELGADPTKVDEDGMGVISSAAAFSSPEMVKLLIEYGADPDIGQAEITPDDCTDDYEPMAPPIAYAVWKGQIENARVLIEAGANPSVAYRYVSLVMSCTADEGDLEMMRVLLDGGADPNYADPDGMTALHWALYRSDALREPMVEALLAAGADPYGIDWYENNYPHTPFTYAAYRNGNPELVELFLEYGADASKAADGSEDRYTPLHHAIYAEQMQSLQLLVDAKKGIETPDADGYRPLHVAANVGNAEAVQILLDGGACATATTDNGHTPIEIAVIREHPEIAEQIMGKAKLHSGPFRLLDFVLKTLAIVVSAYTFAWSAFEGFFVPPGTNNGLWYTLAAGAVSLNIVFWYWWVCRIRFARRRKEQRGSIGVSIRTGVLGAIVTFLLVGPAMLASSAGIGRILGSLDARAFVPADITSNIWATMHPASAEGYLRLMRNFGFLDILPDGALLALAFVLLMLVIGGVQFTIGRRVERINRIKASVSGR